MSLCTCVSTYVCVYMCGVENITHACAANALTPEPSLQPLSQSSVENNITEESKFRSYFDSMQDIFSH